MTLDEIAAHLEIQQVLYRYCRGVDRGDRAMLASVYHEGATDKHGGWVGPGREFGDYLVPLMDQSPVVGQHHITNSLIELDGERAGVESYFIAFHPNNEGPSHTFVTGRYLDVFEKRGGRWLIADREVVIDISRPLDSPQGWEGASAYARGARREADPSHGRVGRR